MSKIFSGRYTAYTDKDFVLFLIGMRINQLWRVDQWWPVAKAMPPMLRTLVQHPEKGFLGGYSTRSWPTIILVQYWRSLDDLLRFAHSPGEPHKAAWQRFYQQSNSLAVGIWHETYVIQAGQYECIYGNMPRFGLGRVFAHVPATGSRHTARQRLRQN
jgi:hypothetical protein